MYLDEKIIGYVSAEILLDGDFVRIRRVYIEEEYRRNKYATTMIIDLLHENVKNDNSDVYAGVYLLSGYKLFKSLGFEIYDIGKNGKLYMIRNS